MNKHSEIQYAMDAVGPGGSDDWKIEPTKHARKFIETAPALAEVLGRSQVDRTAQQYKRHDEEAIVAQKKFQHAVWVSSWLIAASVAAGALILCVGNLADLFPENGQFRITLFAMVSALAIVLGAMATMWVNRLRGGNLLQRWLHSRAEAERMRLEFFDSIIKTDQAKVDVNLDLLKFEYVRRFLVESQIEFYKKRSLEHAADADRTLDRVSWATCAATVLAGIAGCLAVINPYFAILAAAGVVAAAVGTVAAQRENINQDRRNAERYAATCTNLEEISKQFSATRQAIANGKPAVLTEFFTAVGDVLLEEHTQWLEESKRKNAAIDKLAEVLKNQSSELPTKAVKTRAGKKTNRS